MITQFNNFQQNESRIRVAGTNKYYDENIKLVPGGTKTILRNKMFDSPIEKNKINYLTATKFTYNVLKENGIELYKEKDNFKVLRLQDLLKLEFDIKNIGYNENEIKEKLKIFNNLNQLQIKDITINHNKEYLHITIIMENKEITSSDNVFPDIEIIKDND